MTHGYIFSSLHPRPNFVKPHKSLRQRIDQGRKKWMQRTPALAEEMTDHADYRGADGIQDAFSVMCLHDLNI